VHGQTPVSLAVTALVTVLTVSLLNTKLEHILAAQRLLDRRSTPLLQPLTDLLVLLALSKHLLQTLLLRQQLGQLLARQLL
jgi:hypothetical protein